MICSKANPRSIRTSVWCWLHRPDRLKLQRSLETYDVNTRFQGDLYLF